MVIFIKKVNMTLKEIGELRSQEMQGKLRMPKPALSVENKKELRELNQAIAYLMQEDKRNFLLLVKLFIKGFKGINDLKGIGLINCPYEIKTNFGSGRFYHMKDCFEDSVVPKDIEFKQCFHNCFLAVTKDYIKNCEIISGIAYRGGEDDKPFLHAVIRRAGKIIDFNYNLCIDEELYMSLFNFETLSVVDSQKAIHDYPIIKKYGKILNNKGLTTMHAVFAWEDLMDYICDKNRRKNEEIKMLK